MTAGGPRSPYFHPGPVPNPMQNVEYRRLHEKDLVAHTGCYSGVHPTVNASHPWGIRWPTDTLTHQPMAPLPDKRLTATQKRELAELELNYQRAQRREMELALEARERGLPAYHKNPNQLHYIVDVDTEVRLKSTHVLCEDETHILKERIFRSLRPVNERAIENMIAAKGGATKLPHRGMHTAPVKPAMRAQDQSKYELKSVAPKSAPFSIDEIKAKAEAAARRVEEQKRSQPAVADPTAAADPASS